MNDRLIVNLEWGLSFIVKAEVKFINKYQILVKFPKDPPKGIVTEGFMSGMVLQAIKGLSQLLGIEENYLDATYAPNSGIYIFPHGENISFEELRTQ